MKPGAHRSSRRHARLVLIHPNSWLGLVRVILIVMTAPHGFGCSSRRSASPHHESPGVDLSIERALVAAQGQRRAKSKMEQDKDPEGAPLFLVTILGTFQLLVDLRQLPGVDIDEHTAPLIRRDDGQWEMTTYATQNAIAAIRSQGGDVTVH